METVMNIEPCHANNVDRSAAKVPSASLSWKDLWVTVSNSGARSKRTTILEGITGYAEPGKVLAIMGPSGSGKTTLLDCLAGRLSSNMRQSGEILINGRKQALAFGTSAYLTQDDMLMTTLTVKEAIFYSALLQLPNSMPKSEKLERADMTIKMMGLQDSVNTMIGGRTTAGISGGQKRRVSICMEIITRPRLLFLDEPTSGLDSAASYHVMNYIINVARQEQTTVVASIHQPSAEVFELFHDLCLLSCGKLVYFGHTSSTNMFFAENGYPCPSMRNPSDHFLRTINNDFELEVEGKIGTEMATNSLVEAYKLSPVYQDVQTRVLSMHEHQGAKLWKGSQANFISQSLVLTQRSFINMYRDPGYYKLRLVIYLVVSVCVGNIFHHLGNSYDSIQARAGFLGFMSGFFTFMSIGGFPSFVEDMKIFGRERLNGYYGVGAFVISHTISSLPYLFIISLVPGAVAYYLSGLDKRLDKFTYFVLMAISGISLVESLMMMIAGIIPDFLMGIITGAGIQGIVLLTSGFFRLPSELPKAVWRFPIYYINYGTYAQQGVLKNEFEGLVFSAKFPGVQRTISADEILDDLQIPKYSKWVNFVILLGMAMLYRLLFFTIIKIAEFRRNFGRSFSTLARPQSS